MPEPHIIPLTLLRPTQMTVGMLQVKHKRKFIRKLSRRPAELIEFILEHPIRVVRGPAERAYVIDHHHLALALIKEGYETAPMHVDEDFSADKLKEFWKKMEAAHFLHPFDAKNKRRPLSSIPKSLKDLQDDPYRSLAGFVRAEGGFAKVQTPFAEFLWADFYRGRVKEELLAKHFDKALKQALLLSHHADAKKLPGFIPAPKL